MNNSRRDFLKQISVAGATVMAGSLSSCTNNEKRESVLQSGNIENRLIVPKAQGLKITGTFLDEISHDIPHQNWGEKEWDRDFSYMKAIGIDTVIVIRSGYRKFITYPSEYLMKKFESCNFNEGFRFFFLRSLLALVARRVSRPSP